MSQAADVLIIGAGSSGTAAAYYLAKSGVKDIILIDKKGPGAGATGQAAGLIRHHYAERPIVEMVRYGSRCYQRFEEETGLSIDYVNNGYLFLTPENDTGSEEAVAMQREVGADVELLRPEAVQHIFPKGEINVEGIGCGILDHDGGYADPYKVAAGYLEAAKRLGAKVRIGETVRGLKTAGDRVTEVITDRETYSAGVVVNAAGTGAAAISRAAGIELPLRNFSLNHAAAIPDIPFEPDLMTINDGSMADALSFCRPESGGTCLLGMDQEDPDRNYDPDTYYMDVPFRKMGAFYKKLVMRLPFLAGFRITSAFGGLDVRTPDWNPGIGFMSGAPENFYQIVGGSGHAFKLAPAIGRCAAEDITGEARSLDFSVFDIDRLAAFREEDFSGSFAIEG